MQNHTLTLQFVLANVPCAKTDCPHTKDFYIFDDGNGFFTVRSCALSNSITPFIQHDKDIAIRKAVESLNLKSVICNFHTLAAVRRRIDDRKTLAYFLRPLEIGFKCVMRSWSQEIRLELAQKYYDFIEKTIPDQLLPLQVKEDFINYLKTHWFESALWGSEFTAENLYQITPTQKRNPLVLTDNVTERKFREIDETYLHGFLNRSIAQFYFMVINKVLHTYILECKAISNELDDSIRLANINSRTKELKIASRGLQIYNAKYIISAANDSDWKLVKSVSTFPSTCLPCPSQCIADNCHSPDLDTIQPRRSQANLNNMNLDHNYDLVSKSKSILSFLGQSVCGIFTDVLINLIPGDLKQQFNDGYYICNLKLAICSCCYFIRSHNFMEELGDKRKELHLTSGEFSNSTKSSKDGPPNKRRKTNKRKNQLTGKVNKDRMSSKLILCSDCMEDVRRTKEIEEIKSRKLILLKTFMHTNLGEGLHPGVLIKSELGMSIHYLVRKRTHLFRPSAVVIWSSQLHKHNKNILGKHMAPIPEPYFGASLMVEVSYVESNGSVMFLLLLVVMTSDESSEGCL
ncbi:hypothetical protein GQR58_003871 [Nymphon striatum]|nr:hypothetical protein GQR58_003871 [Nymphon striatum]